MSIKTVNYTSALVIGFATCAASCKKKEDIKDVKYLYDDNQKFERVNPNSINGLLSHQKWDQNKIENFIHTATTQSEVEGMMGLPFSESPWKGDLMVNYYLDTNPKIAGLRGIKGYSGFYLIYKKGKISTYSPMFQY